MTEGYGGGLAVLFIFHSLVDAKGVEPLSESTARKLLRVCPVYDWHRESMVPFRRELLLQRLRRCSPVYVHWISGSRLDRASARLLRGGAWPDRCHWLL